ncbi:MAG: Gfo/Idh/MocA family oxidoreductase [Eubacteriales bacterium]|nr:Gfo/Idh/MocA family oxidoreductase [Clostridiales bacterium]MDD7594630.1 Gfo/Idh/MocA family oxidoreductase [Clostridiales bacterium]MDY4886392.1 Gfo/Idh/MocA family oxidoreductase [Eubacteriales bacterium]MDY5860264.1 Gfo/Idh/MocA family oxidoreductase [Eubacteriales bacterium]
MADKSMDGLNTFTAQTAESVDTSRKLRVGIIGCGWIAGSHIKAYLNQPDVEIVAGADLVPGKAAAFFEKYGVEGVKTDYASHKEMLDDESLHLDAVSICTYNRQHAAPAIYALDKGVNVLLEKPFTVTLDEAVEVMKAEKRSGKVLSIGFQPRLDANMQMIKKIVQSGELGKIYYIQTGGGRRRGIPTPYGTSFIADETAGIGALGDIGCYSLDMVLNAIGYPKPLTVTGYKSAFFGKDPNYCGYRADKRAEYSKAFQVDDFAAAFIRLEGDIVLDFRIAWAMNMDTPGDTIILGTKGGLRIPSTECWNGTVGGPMKIYHEVCGQQVETEIPIITMKKGLFDLKIRTFLDACKNGTPAPVPSSQIIYNQAIIDGIARSAECGHEVEITVPEI